MQKTIDANGPGIEESLARLLQGADPNDPGPLQKFHDRDTHNEITTDTFDGGKTVAGGYRVTLTNKDGEKVT